MVTLTSSYRPIWVVTSANKAPPKIQNLHPEFPIGNGACVFG